MAGWPYDYSDRFNTELGPEEEVAFQEFMGEMRRRHGRDLLKDLPVYDVRGFWKGSGAKAVEAFAARKGHAPDTWKKPSHPTFSDESAYHGTRGDFGGAWEGGKWTYEGGEEVFTPSKRMLEVTHRRERLEEFFRAEKGARLRLPE